MKTFKFNHNDYVTVTLTKEGAEHLNEKRKEFYDQYPKLARGKCNYEEDDIYRTQFWVFIGDFGEMMVLGSLSPIKMGDITVESSLES